MGKGGEAGKREDRKLSRPQGAQSAPFVAPAIREVPIPGGIPRFEIPDWQEDYGVVAGITGRGAEPGRGFDLGLWSNQPVGDVMSRWLAFRRALPGFNAVALGNQAHGIEVASIESGRGWIQVEGIDGWISTTPGILLTVTVADCVPVYLLAPGRGVALLHAGWRGTAGGILRRGFERLKAETGSSGADIIMHCGVAICGECYEVGSEVMEACGVPVSGSGPWYLDLRAHLIGQGREMGLTQGSLSSWCSAHDRKSFYSHRGSAGTDGRMVAYLGMTRPGALSE
jgi:polyphenol oxidase